MSEKHNQIKTSPYEIVDELKPFPKRMTAFSRMCWDKTCIGYVRKGKSQKQIIAEGKPGYSRIDFALKSASCLKEYGNKKTQWIFNPPGLKSGDANGI